MGETFTYQHVNKDTAPKSQFDLVQTGKSNFDKDNKRQTFVAVGGRPSRVKARPGSHCRSVTAVVCEASTRERCVAFTTALLPRSSTPSS